MKQKLMNWFLSGLIGLVTGITLTENGCVYVPKETKIIDNTWIEHHTDTLVIIQEKKVPVPVTVYKQVSKDYFLRDTLYRDLTTVIDTSDADLIAIPFNTYIDSTETSDYKFTYKAEVMGELVTFEPTITLYQDSTVVHKEEQMFIPKTPDWTVTIGMSNKVNFLGSFGYKGWQIGLDANPQGINQFFISKTFYLK